MNVDILGISELRWTGMGEFNSDDHYIYYCGQEFLRRNGVAIMVNKRVRNAVLGCNLKNDRMISVHFQGKPFNIMVIQAGFRKGRGTRDQIAKICYIIKKAREFQKNISFCFIDHTKSYDCVDHNNLCKIIRDGNTRPADLLPEKFTCRSRSNS